MKSIAILLFALLVTNQAIGQTLYVPSGTGGIGTSSVTGNVGVGTSSPDLKFTVSGPIRAGEYIKFSNPASQQNFITGQYEPMIYGSTSGGTIPGGSASLILQAGSTQTNRYIFFRTADQNRMFIDYGGNIGIGNTSPQGKLHIAAFDESIQSALSIRQENNSAFGFDLGLDESLNGNMFLYRVHSNNRYAVIEFSRDLGTMGIGHAPVSGYTLAVAGKTLTDEINVKVTSTWDKVFEKDYVLPSLQSVKKYINQNKHLPEVPSAKEMEANGINLSEMNMLLLKKVEELTLYMIDLKEENKELKTRIDKLEKKHD